MYSIMLGIIVSVFIMSGAFLTWMDCSNSLKAKQMRVAVALYASTGYSWKECYKKAKTTVR